MAPQARNVLPAGQNGLPLIKNAWEPPLYVADGYDMADMVVKMDTFGSKNHAGIVEETIFLAYNEIPPHGFSISSLDVLQRLIGLQDYWATDQVAKLAAEAEARMDVAARRAKVDPDRSNYDIITAMESLKGMNIEHDDDYDLEVELEKAMLEDSVSSSDSESPSAPAIKQSGFKRPFLSASTTKKKQPSMNFEQVPKRIRKGSIPRKPPPIAKPANRKILRRQQPPMQSLNLAFRPKSTGVGCQKPSVA
ncbi:MAG: hypothetical protein M1830_003224 [Pleopsidium flavum]|nr:MAG: hypothetical protein M1830_003224 [Pleopsidium flavum]